MFATLVLKLEQALTAECAILRFSESLRVQGSVPSGVRLTEWRIHDQCGVVVRMYAEYESFVVALIEEWLSRLPALYPKYSDLPEGIRLQHRVGIATILQKLGTGHYPDVTESSAIDALSGVVSDRPYKLLPEAFWVANNANLRLETAKGIVKQVCAGDPSVFLSNVSQLQQVLTKFDTSLREELKMLVLARNIASHDDIRELEGIDVHERRAACVVAFARGLASYFEMLVTQREIDAGLTKPLGTVIRVFSDRVSGVEVASQGIELKIGTSLLAMTPKDCFRVVIESIHIGPVPHEQLATVTPLQIGLKTSIALPRRAILVALMD